MTVTDTSSALKKKHKHYKPGFGDVLENGVTTNTILPASPLPTNLPWAQYCKPDRQRAARHDPVNLRSTIISFTTSCCSVTVSQYLLWYAEGCTKGMGKSR